MPRLALCLIVRDEARVIERCIASVLPVIDYWVICDTGSTDDTPAVIRRALAGVPGELHHHPWVDFGQNRTALMRLARGKADYLLLLDADWTLEAEPGAFDRLTADSYMVRHAGDPEFLNKRLVRGDLDWRYLGAVHEYIDSPQETTVERLAGVVIHNHCDGGARAGRHERDALLLADELARDPADTRAAFYLAQTYRDLGRRDQAIEAYAHRAEMGGWEEEVFYSLYQVGVLRAQAGDWPDAMTSLIAAWEYRPSRIEPLYELSGWLRRRHQYQTAHLFAQHGLGQPAPDDVLFLGRWIYAYGMLFEYSITAYWVGDLHGALRACDRLLDMVGLPDAYRRQTLENRGYCLGALETARSAAPAKAAARRPVVRLPRPTPKP